MDWSKIERLRNAIQGGDFEFDVGGFVESMLRDSPFKNEA
jgi:hypothetical protein